MKYFIASDLHGHTTNCRKMLAHFRREQADRLLLLGDLLYHGHWSYDEEPEVYEQLNEFTGQITAVRGNCDRATDQIAFTFPMLEDLISLELDGRTAYLTHGHLLTPKGAGAFPEGSILMSGHTHIPMAKMEGGNLHINPGSLGSPRGDSPASYIIYENGLFRWFTPEGTEFMRYE